MKTKKQIVYEIGDQTKGYELRDALAMPTQPPPSAPPVAPGTEGPMVRTQIYLSHAEHEFVLGEAGRRKLPMAAVIRQYIDEQMEIPDVAWANNPMLQATDDETAGPEDGSLNHDHYVYGAPKRFVKKDGAWAKAAALPDDYFDAPAEKREEVHK